MNDSAVLDLETGLVWQRAPDTTAVTWTFGVDLCENLFLGNRGGWRLPRVEELISLVDRNASNPSLPSGHPFDLSGQVEFWTSSTDQDVPTNGKGIDLIDGIVGVAPKFSSLPYWCVRGGAPNMFTSQPNS